MGQELFDITPTDDIWVTANYKETQLRKMRPGQAVTISVDTLGRDFKGYIEDMPGATGARYSLLPPENATGNYVKVVQRLPSSPDSARTRRVAITVCRHMSVATEGVVEVGDYGWSHRCRMDAEIQPMADCYCGHARHVHGGDGHLDCGGCTPLHRRQRFGNQRRGDMGADKLPGCQRNLYSDEHMAFAQIRPQALFDYVRANFHGRLVRLRVMAKQLPIFILIARAIQERRDAALQPLALAILMESFPPAKRGVAMAMYALGVVVAPVIGPTLGGYLTDQISWRWAFYINIPIGLVAVLMEADVFKIRPSQQPPGPLDATGLAFLALFLGSLQYVCDKGQEDDWFGSSLICWMSIICIVGFIAWIVRERFAKSPLVDLCIFLNRNFAIGCLLIARGQVFGLAATTILPLFYQTQRQRYFRRSAVAPRGPEPWSRRWWLASSSAGSIPAS